MVDGRSTVSPHRFGGVRPVLHMPFGDSSDRPILWSELEALAERMLAADVDGLVVLGLASEACALTEPERDEAVGRIVAVIDGRVPLVVGIDGATPIALDRATRASHRGAAGLMVLPPPGVSDLTVLLILAPVTPDDGGIALIRNARTGTTEALRLGEQLEDLPAELASMDPLRIWLRWEGEDHELTRRGLTDEERKRLGDVL